MLELEGGMYYVGTSDDPEKRFLYHMRGDGAARTRMHCPRRILKVTDGGGMFEEDKVTKEYMAKYGIDNVRGSSCEQIVLSPDHKKLLKKEIWMAQNVCMRCGWASHFIKDCWARTDACGDPIEENTEMHHGAHVEQRGRQYRQENRCRRCNRTNHRTSNCYATTHLDGSEL